MRSVGKINNNNLTVLFVPIDAVGHVNASVGIAEVLIQAGHQVVFVVSDQWRGRLTKYGIQEILLTEAGRVTIGAQVKNTLGVGLAAIGVKSEWKAFRDEANRVKAGIRRDFNSYLLDNGCEPIDYKEMTFFYQSFKDLKSLPPKWHRFDNFKRQEKHVIFYLPMKLRDRPGKFIYFSLGSMGAADVDNMKRLVTILFIVSKGPKHNEFELADNMWGEGSVPQIQVLPLVDLVITHGGNNTVTETMYFGKPMIVLPLLGDQWDNAQRVEDKGFGIRLDAYKCSEEELLNAIQNLLNNKELNEKLLKISQRIQSDNSIARPKHNEIELAANMWGEGSVPQIQVLPLVDLVITHGGNNTVTETMYFGKPMIVLPLLGDQWDNAQRVEDKGFGIRLDAYKCSEE
ncbi:unnamed protein product, partial [Medioppia subpectinata]